MQNFLIIKHQIYYLQAIELSSSWVAIKSSTYIAAIWDCLQAITLLRLWIATKNL